MVVSGDGGVLRYEFRGLLLAVLIGVRGHPAGRRRARLSERRAAACTSLGITGASPSTDATIR